MGYNKQKYWEVRSTTSSLLCPHLKTSCLETSREEPQLSYMDLMAPPDSSSTSRGHIWDPWRSPEIHPHPTAQPLSDFFNGQPLRNLYERSPTPRLLLPSTLWCTADTSKLPRGKSPRPTLFLFCTSSYASFTFTQLGSFTPKILHWDSGDTFIA